MKRINGIPIPYDFDYVTYPECKKYCAAKILKGPRAGDIQCYSSDHIKPCNYYGDSKGNRKKQLTD